VLHLWPMAMMLLIRVAALLWYFFTEGYFWKLPLCWCAGVGVCYVIYYVGNALDELSFRILDVVDRWRYPCSPSSRQQNDQ
jgi:hypothetical protein